MSDYLGDPTADYEAPLMTAHCTCDRCGSEWDAEFYADTAEPFGFVCCECNSEDVTHTLYGEDPADEEPTP